MRVIHCHCAECFGLGCAEVGVAVPLPRSLYRTPLAPRMEGIRVGRSKEPNESERSAGSNPILLGGLDPVGVLGSSRLCREPCRELAADAGRGIRESSERMTNIYSIVRDYTLN